MQLSRAIFTIALITGLSLAPTRAMAELDPTEALELARAQWFEGIPEERLDRLSRDAHSALRELLDDPSEAAHHSAAIELLGLVGGRAAYPIVSGYEEKAARAEGDGVSPDVHRARMAVPVALGHLAQRDPRALRALLKEADRTDGPRWKTKRMKADRVSRLHRELCAMGLGLSGRDEAPAALRRMRASGDAESWRRHIAEALELHRRNAPTGNGGSR